MYLLLSGARCNLGDFLITERAAELLRALRPDRELCIAPAWEPLDPGSDPVRSARAVVIAGGPGYQPRLHPDVYPLVERLDDLPCPVVPLGLGWKGRAGDAFALDRYRFTPASLEALRWMSRHTAALGCRDPLSAEVLLRHGIRNVETIGCPAWYHLDSLGQPFTRPMEVERVVFTPAQLHALRDQSIGVARRIAELWPAAERICSFHRGFEQAGRWISEADVENNRAIAAEAADLGFRLADVTGDLARIGFYEECTLHVGYRVHAHLWFLSRRKPSLLIEEDGRGAGAGLALGLQGVPAFRPSRVGQRLRRRLPDRATRILGRGAEPYRVDPDVPDRVEALARQDLASRFARYEKTGPVLDARFERMREFIGALP